MEDRDKVLDLVRKLMALTESPNEHEAARAAEKVQELLFKHKLTMAEAEAHRGDPRGPIMIEVEADVLSRKNWGRWKPSLAWGVARYNFCTGFHSPNRGKFIFIGQETEVAVAKELYEWLVIQVEDSVRRAIISYQGYSRIPTFRRSFFTGAVSTVVSRLGDRWRELQGQSKQSTALVVHSSALLEQYKHQRYPNLIKGKSINMANGSYEGYVAGVKAGREMEITVKKKVGQGPLRLK